MVGAHSTPLIRLLYLYQLPQMSKYASNQGTTLYVNKIQTKAIRISASSEMKRALNSGLDSIL